MGKFAALFQALNENAASKDCRPALRIHALSITKQLWRGNYSKASNFSMPKAALLLSASLQYFRTHITLVFYQAFFLSQTLWLRVSKGIRSCLIRSRFVTQKPCFSFLSISLFSSLYLFGNALFVFLYFLDHPSTSSDVFPHSFSRFRYSWNHFLVSFSHSRSSLVDFLDPFLHF